MDIKQLMNKTLPYLVAILIFIALSFAYFSPILGGKDLPQMDNTHAIGMSKELADYEAETGRQSMWTNSMFAGMPAYQIKGGTPMNVYYYLSKIISLGLPFTTVAIVFLYMLGFFILLVSLKVDKWLSLAGAIAFAFASYNLIIIEAGHIMKAYAIAFMAPVLAGSILLYRGKYWVGGILTAFALGLEIAMNHVQITYYLALTVLVMVIAYFVKAIKEKALRPFFISSAVMVVAVIMAVLPNITNLWTTYEYGQESIRGPSELHHHDEVGDGLDKDYALSWSYGKAETLTILIPNFAGGGSSDGFDEDSETYNALIRMGLPRQNALQITQAMPTYWGEMPFTSGPVYFGAIIIFLFIFGLFTVKGPEKWWLLAATILSIMLAWGKNLGWFTDLFFYNFPLYNKFRTVSMTLVIAGVTMPLLGFLALRHVFQEKTDKQQTLLALYISAGITGGLALIFALVPQLFFDFTSETDRMTLLSMGFPEEMLQPMLNALPADRAGMFRADAFRSMLLVAVGAGLLWLLIQEKIQKKYFAIAIAVALLIDVWPISKRYLNNEDFVPKRQVQNQFVPTTADEFILKDIDRHFRVLNMSRNPFTEVHTSYFHKSIGGYHGAKLRRYQDLIDSCITPSWRTIIGTLQQQPTAEQVNQLLAQQNVLNMLNTKYLIYSPEAMPIVNFHALGNAWFVDNYEIVENANQELAALDEFDPAKTAIIDKRFASQVEGLAQGIADTTATVEFMQYAPDILKYHVETSQKRLLVFSEIYYDKGWQAYLNDEPAEHFRVNYALRAMVVPEGAHDIEFRFEPRSYEVGQRIALGSSVLAVLLLLGMMAKKMRDRKNAPPTEIASEPETTPPPKKKKKAKKHAKK